LAAITLWIVVCQVSTTAVFMQALNSTYGQPSSGFRTGLKPASPSRARTVSASAE
jgi:hypothetical protein